jgi:hypothetical protein
MMLFVGGGLIPPVFGVVAGIIGARVRQKELKKPHIRNYKACRVEPLYMQDPNPLASTILEEVKKEDE